MLLVCPATSTTLNDTGQRKDGTGLLYYHARYYDPTLGRFLSADSIVPEGRIVREERHLHYSEEHYTIH